MFFQSTDPKPVRPRAAVPTQEQLSLAWTDLFQSPG